MSTTALAWERLRLDPQPLAEGRAAAVYRAELAPPPDAAPARHAPAAPVAVIVKVARDGAEALLFAEAQALDALARRGVTPRLHGLVRAPGGRTALVREHVDGVSLATLIERATVRRRWQGARRWNAPTRALVAAVLDAVEALHDAGWVHNDLKPDDVFVRLHDDGRFTVVLIDLGLAAKERRGGPGGTVAYAAPERLDGAPGTVRSDLWSLGAILFELLAGTRAYPSDHPVDARLERRVPVDRSPREAAALAWRHLPREVQIALAAALDPDPTRRPKHVRALRDALGLDRDDGLAPVPSRTASALASARAAPSLASAPAGAGRAPHTPHTPSFAGAGAPSRTTRAALLACAAVATVLALVLGFGPVSRALGLSAAPRANDPVACDAMQRRATALCRDVLDPTRAAECRAALTTLAPHEGCAARASLLGACEDRP